MTGAYCASIMLIIFLTICKPSNDVDVVFSANCILLVLPFHQILAAFKLADESIFLSCCLHSNFQLLLLLETQV